jgi:HK97 gp10 family phage protein
MKFEYDSRFPSIIDDLTTRVDEIARKAADDIVDRAKARVPIRSGDLHDALRAEKLGADGYAVIAGNTDVFYGHLVEFGEAGRPARPFLIPALEAGREGIAREARDRLRDL